MENKTQEIINKVNSVLENKSFIHPAKRTQHSYISSPTDSVETVARDGKIRHKFKILKDKVMDKGPDLERESMCRKARLKAHTLKADIKKEMSDNARDGIV